MISDYFTIEFDLYRQEWTMDDDSNSYSTAIKQGTLNGHLQQGSFELSENLGLAITKVFRIWCSVNDDIREGDELRAGGYSYFVKSKKEFLVGGIKHIELIVERDLIVSI